MKTLQSSSLLLCCIIFHILATRVVVHATIFINDLQPNNQNSINMDEWTQFRARIESDDKDCAIQTVDLHATGYALTNYQTRESINCPINYYCLDVLFSGKGSNWWFVELFDVCGQIKQSEIIYLCVENCPNNIISLWNITWMKYYLSFGSKANQVDFIITMKHILIFGAIAINGGVFS